METEQQRPPPAVTVLGRPREPQQPQPPSPTPGDFAAAAAGGPELPSTTQPPIEFRGFEYFAQRDFNEFKDASRAYFAEKNDAPLSWLGDATPPASAHPSLDESRPAPGQFPYQSNRKEPKRKRAVILGLRRQWFWTVLAITGVLVIVAIGVGVGVSTSQAASRSKSASVVVGPTYVVMFS